MRMIRLEMELLRPKYTKQDPVFCKKKGLLCVRARIFSGSKLNNPLSTFSGSFLMKLKSRIVLDGPCDDDYDDSERL